MFKGMMRRKKGLLLALSALLGLGGISAFAGMDARSIQEVRAETATMTIDFTNGSSKDTFTNLPTSSSTTDATVTVTSENNLQFVINSGYKNSSNTFLMLGKSGAYLYNTTSLVDTHGSINSITINYSSTTSEKVKYSFAISDSVISNAPSTWTESGISVTKSGSKTINAPTTASNPGFFRIQVTNSNNIQISSISIEYTLPVTDPYVEFDSESLTGMVGDTKTLTATANNFSDGAALTYTWSLAEGGDSYVALTSADNVATIKFNDAGSTSVTCSVTDGTNTAEVSCPITVNSLVSSVTISGGSAVAIGDDLQLTAAVEPSTASQAVTWSSDNTSVAIVNSNGVVTGVSAGTAIITATAAGTEISGSIDITVSASTQKYIYHKITSADGLKDGDRLIIASYINNAWYAAKSSVLSNSYTTASEATIAGANLITTSEGTAWRYTVDSENRVLLWDPSSSTPYFSSTHSGNSYRAFPAATAGEGAYWTVSFNSDGTAKIVSDLNVMIAGTLYSSTAEFAGYSSTTESTSALDVYLFKREVGVDLESVSVTAGEAGTSILQGKTTTLTATASPASDFTEIAWSSSDANVATVDGNGVVTAVGPGTATITATAYNHNSVTGEIAITVEEDAIESLTYTGTVAAQYAGLNFDPTGLTFSLVRKSGATQEVLSSQLTFSPSSLTTDTQTVVATYSEGITCEIAVTVEDAETYKMVESASDLVLGDSYVMVGANSDSTEWHAMSTALHSSGYYQAVEITVANNSFVDTGLDISVLTLGAGNNGHYALWNNTSVDADNNTTSGYIGISSSDVTCTSTRTSLSFTLDSSTHQISMLYDSSTYYLQFNSGSPRFKPYGSSSNQQDVYLFHATSGTNDGVNAWASDFLTKSGAVCSNTQDLEKPDDLMGNIAISTLSTPAQDILKHATSANASGDLANALARYDFIVNKYTTCTDVLGRRGTVSTGLLRSGLTNEESSTYIIISTIAGATALAGTVFLIRKKKASREEEE